MSCIEQWRREIELWTHLECVVFHGSQDDRRLILRYEWYHQHPNEPEKFLVRFHKFHILLTTYEMILAETDLLSSIQWESMIIDEGHRIKSTQSKLLQSLLRFKSRHRVVLTGTPLQNHIQELWSILHFLHPSKFASKSEFLNKFGNLKSSEQVKALHTLLRPYMLRRMKQDVEQNIPFKSEKIIEVDLTSVQKRYYRAILERNQEFLRKGVRKANAPSLNNILMELRKCCNHPFLINGAEERLVEEKLALEKTPDDESKGRKRKRRDSEKISDELLLSTSAKFVLVEKLLVKLREGGHRVLIFSQMVALLDLLEDFLNLKDYPFERLDGSVNRNLRQAAIDRFSDKTNDHFVFLLSTRAGFFFDIFLFLFSDLLNYVFLLKRWSWIEFNSCRHCDNL